MKVIFLVASMFGGGVERTVTYLSEYFAENDVDTTVLSIGDINFYDVDKKVKYKSLNIPNTEVTSGKFVKIFRYLKRHVLVNFYLLKHHPDVVVCIAPQVTRYVMTLHKLKMFKLVTSERNNPDYDTAKEAEIKKEAFASCDGIVFQTERAMAYFSEEVQNKGVVIPNAVGNRYALSTEASFEPAKKFSAIGRLTKQKDYPTMLKAFAIVQKKYPDYELDIYGIGEDQEALKSMVQELDIAEKVNFMGICQDAAEKIADSTCFLLSSIYEGMPNVLMEALAIGLPCISTDCPFGPAELIENQKNGILVPVGDYLAYAEAMLKMIENPSFARMCGANSRKILQSNSVEKIGSQYLGFVKALCNK